MRGLQPVVPGNRAGLSAGTRSRRAPASSVKLTEDGKNVAKASYSRYYESMYTSEYAQHQRQQHRQTGGVATYAWLGDLNGNGKVDPQRARRVQEPVHAAGEHDRSEPEGSEERRDHVRVPARADEQRVVQRRLDPALVQRRHDRPELLGFAVHQTSSTAYMPATFLDFGPDNLRSTADDRNLTFYNVAPAYLGQGHVLPHQLRQQRRRSSCTQRYKALEMSLGKRMSNRWQMQGVVRVVAPRRRPRARLHEPEQPDSTSSAQRPRRQRSAARLQAARQLPGAVGHQRRRELPGAERPAARSHLERRVHAGHDELCSSNRAAPIARTSSACCRCGPTRASASAGTARRSSPSCTTCSTRAPARAATARSRAATPRRRRSKRRELTMSYFGRIQEIVAPRVLKIGFKFDF